MSDGAPSTATNALVLQFFDEHRSHRSAFRLLLGHLLLEDGDTNHKYFEQEWRQSMIQQQFSSANVETVMARLIEQQTKGRSEAESRKRPRKQQQSSDDDDDDEEEDTPPPATEKVNTEPHRTQLSSTPMQRLPARMSGGGGTPLSQQRFQRIDSSKVQFAHDRLKYNVAEADVAAHKQNQKLLAVRGKDFTKQKQKNKGKLYAAGVNQNVRSFKFEEE